MKKVSEESCIEVAKIKDKIKIPCDPGSTGPHTNDMNRFEECDFQECDKYLKLHNNQNNPV